LGISTESSQVVFCWEWKNDLDIWVKFTSQQQKILETAWLQNLDEISLPSSRSGSDDSKLPRPPRAEKFKFLVKRKQ